MHAPISRKPHYHSVGIGWDSRGSDPVFCQINILYFWDSFCQCYIKSQLNPQWVSELCWDVDLSLLWYLKFDWMHAQYVEYTISWALALNQLTACICNCLISWWKMSTVQENIYKSNSPLLCPCTRKGQDYRGNL